MIRAKHAKTRRIVFEFKDRRPQYSIVKLLRAPGFKRRKLMTGSLRVTIEDARLEQLKT